nr:hypothetical protein CPGR_00239 [Mycolicibacter nonchromogenicus]
MGLPELAQVEDDPLAVAILEELRGPRTMRMPCQSRPGDATADEENGARISAECDLEDAEVAAVEETLCEELTEALPVHAGGRVDLRDDRVLHHANGDQEPTRIGRRQRLPDALSDPLRAAQLCGVGGLRGQWTRRVDGRDEVEVLVHVEPQRGLRSRSLSSRLDGLVHRLVRRFLRLFAVTEQVAVRAHI